MTPYIKRFRSPLRVELIGPHRWRVFDSFEYRLGALTGAGYVRVLAGFDTDFASIPRALWWLYPPAGASFTGAALIHDYIYRTGVVSRDDGSVRHVTRAEADAIFLEAMVVLGVGWLSRQLIYRGVRMVGGAAWTRHRKADDAATP